MHEDIIEKHIRGCQQGDRLSQRWVFDRYYRLMFGVCMRYVSDRDAVQDVVQEGFLKVFSGIDRFASKGSFEGWIRRIMVNTCISHLRKKNIIDLSDEDFVFNAAATDNLENTTVNDIQKLIDALPDGYRVVFNLFAIEGYKHSEIAKKLLCSFALALA